MGLKYSPNQVATAMLVADSDREQAQAMEQINADIVDMINMACFAPGADGDPDCTYLPVRNVNDVKFVVAQAAARLRCLLSHESEEE